MGRFLIVSKEEQLEEYKQLSDFYGVGFELNDFFEPDVLEDESRIDALVKRYEEAGIPKGSTMHGAFLDVIVFSQDNQIRRISEKRMRQSMQIANRLGVKGVVFHTNCNPLLEGAEYDSRVVDFTADFLSVLLKEYPGVDIYLENMFDRTPDILRRISERLSMYRNYGVCFDYAHASVYGVEMELWVKALAGYVKHLHINDNDLYHDLHLAVGDGMLDWKQFERYYRQYFTDCSVLIETARIADQKKSLEYLIREMELLNRNQDIEE